MKFDQDFDETEVGTIKKPCTNCTRLLFISKMSYFNKSKDRVQS